MVPARTFSFGPQRVCCVIEESEEQIEDAPELPRDRIARGRAGVSNPQNCGFWSVV